MDGKMTVLLVLLLLMLTHIHVKLQPSISNHENQGCKVIKLFIIFLKLHWLPFDDRP
jgi:hypothetical protein